ncbi:MAG: DUF1318 domain-containing protein [Phycisphaerales bacterium]|nr:DUF1318 domain-containing protein [Phycisphaerales bacterium]
MKRLTLILCALLTLGALASHAHAQPTKEQLKGQFKARETELRNLQQRGQIGETIDGYVDAVDARAAGEDSIARLLSDENRDRRALYQLLADEINKENPQAPVKATLETIATRNALRNIERAGPDEFLRVGKDHWIRAKDFPRFQRLTQLKTQGRVGETAGGLVEIVKDGDRADKSLIAVVEEENSRRNTEYSALAAKERVDAADIAKRVGQRNVQNARIGDMVKDDRGAWRKR